MVFVLIQNVLGIEHLKKINGVNCMKIKRCKNCNDILPMSSSDYGLVDYLCYVCWTKREEKRKE